MKIGEFAAEIVINFEIEKYGNWRVERAFLREAILYPLRNN